MDISEFINNLGSSDFKSLLVVLEAYQEAKREGFSHVEYFGFNQNSGNIYCAIEDNITIYSSFGGDAYYCPSDDEEKEFQSLDELLEYLKK